MRNSNAQWATLDDIEQVTCLRLQYFREEYGNSNEGDFNLLFKNNILYLKEHLNRDCFISVIKENSTVVSSAYINIYSRAPNLGRPNGLYGEIYGVYTLPEYRKQGFGTKNVSNLINKSRELNLSQIFLSASENGFNVYKNLGFKIDDSPDINMNYKILSISDCL